MALDAAASFSEAQRWFYVRENKELRDPRKSGDFFWQDPVLRAVRDAVGQMLGGIERVYADDDPPRMKAVQKDAKGLSMVLDFSQLSAGQRNLMALTIDFARRLALTYPGWDNPLEAPGILLIDEIELNLHPKWQQTVIPHLRKVFPDTQIVVATHSPLVLSTLHARQIRILRGQQIFVPSVETYGTESDRVQRQVMDTETTPPENIAPTYQGTVQDNRRCAKGKRSEAATMVRATRSRCRDAIFGCGTAMRTHPA
jgi:predicted ATP-binding protein involved in virulence